jgi:hypothetical protein
MAGFNKIGYIFTFPYWLYTSSSKPPDDVVFQYKDITYKVYKPFRSSPANFSGLPSPKISSIPDIKFKFGEHIHQFNNLNTCSVIPNIDRDAEGKFKLSVAHKPLWDTKIEPFPMDSLRIDVNFGKTETISENGLFASNLFTEIIDWTRIITKQWWIGKAPNTDNLRMILPLDKNGSVIDTPRANLKGRTFTGIEKAIDRYNWQIIMKSVKSEEEKPYYELLFLDAHYFFSSGDLRNSILSFSFCLENLLELVFKKIWIKNEEKKFKKGRVMSGNNILNHLTVDFERLGEERYDKVDPDNYNLINELWNYRGEIAHGKVDIKSFSNKNLNVSSEEVKEILGAVKKCKNWLLNKYFK